MIMNQKLTNLFQNISQINPPEKLERVILLRIEKIQKRRLLVKTILSFSGAFSSILAGAYIFSFFGKTFLNSQFWNILSLAFSDASVVAVHYREFFFSLLETLPAMTFIIMLVPILTLLLSLYFICEIYNKFNKPKYYF